MNTFPEYTEDMEGSGEVYLNVLRTIIGDDTKNLTLLDLGCGECAQTRQMEWKASVHVDLIDDPRRPHTLPFIKCDVRNVADFHHYDVCLASDLIEHLPRIDGICLLAAMKLSPLAIVFTPLGEYLVSPESEDPHTHKSGWTPADFPSGWQFKVFPNWHKQMNLGAFFAWHRR